MYFIFSYSGLVVLQFCIELCSCSIHIGDEEECSNACGQEAKKNPADEGEVKLEESPLVALHHFAGLLKSFFRRDFCIVSEDVGDDCILIGLDDTGNDKQQAPQNGFDVHQL